MIRKPFFYILTVALIIRFVAIDHGFPFIYHSDEPAIIRSALGIRFDHNPHHFDWPHLYIYLNYFVYMIFAKFRDLVTLWGLKSSAAQIAPLIYNDNLIFYLLTRILSALLGALTVIPVYLWVKKLINKNAGLMSSALMALTPLHVRNSHYALIDVPMLFFLSWSLYFATFSPTLSGLFLGFSASTKYNGILGAPFIMLYYLTIKRKFSDFFKTGIFTILGFILGTPFSIIDYKTFVRTDSPQGALWQFTNVGKVGFVDQVGQFISALITKLPDNTGYGMMILFAIGLIYIISKKYVCIFPLLCALTFLSLTFYISGLEKNRSHYYLITYPYLLLVSGWVLAVLANKVKKVPFRVAVITLALLPSVVLSISNVVDLVNKTSSTVYGGDIKENVKINP